jgi:glycosyltransferase involved in cell wall biosynthesis
MNILLLNYEYPPLGGGAGVCSKYHAEGLALLNHKVTVITAWYNGYNEIEETGDLRIIRVRSLRKHIHKSNPLEMFSWALKTRKYYSTNLAKERFDICLTNFAIPGAIAADFIKKKYKLPYIIISHGQDVPWFFPRQLFFYHAALYFKLKAYFNRSLANILLTDSMKRSVDKMVSTKQRSKNIVIPNGCNIEFFKPDYSLRSADFKIIFVGRLRQQKDPFTFLKALKILKQKNLNFSAKIIGDGPMRKGIENYIIRNGLNDFVKITGWVSKEKMLDEYRKSSLLVSTSLDEGMSIALLEAISSGIYVIATPASGNSEMISGNVNGEITAFGNHKELAERIEDFHQLKFKNDYKTPEWFLDAFRDKYKWSNIVSEYDEMLKGLSL